MKIVITGGIGDAIAIESLMTDAEREQIETIYYATRAVTGCKQLFTKIPSFPRLQNQITVWNDFSKHFAFYDALQMTRRIGTHGKHYLPIIKEVKEAKDFSISKIFNEKRSYTYSSFIRFELANTNFNLPKEYVCVCPYTISDQRDKKRDFNEKDWETTTKILKEMDLPGVVINQGESYIPDNYINLANKTTIREAIEVVKASKGYIGIDSCLSVIAAKVCDLKIIKSCNDHCYRWAHVYFAPNLTWPFLKKEISVGDQAPS